MDRYEYDVRRTYGTLEVDVLKRPVRIVGQVKVRGLAWSLYPDWVQYAFWWRWIMMGYGYIAFRKRFAARRRIVWINGGWVRQPA